MRIKLAKIEILHITDCYDGGVFTAINKIAEEYKSANHSLLFAGHSRVPNVFARATRFESKNPICRIFQISKLTKALKVDVIHLHSSRAGALARVVKPNAKVIYQPHGVAFVSALWNSPTRWVFREIERFLSTRTDLILAVSKFEAIEMERISGNCPVLHLPNVSQIQGGNEKKITNFKVVMSGRIAEQKDPEFFAEIARKCSEIRPEFEFVWIGDGDMKLRNYLESANVRVTGWVTESMLTEELETTSCYLHTAIAEGFPLTILDAARFEIPMLVRRIPHLHGYNLTEFSTAHEASQLLIRLESNQHYVDSVSEISRAINDEHTNSNLIDTYTRALKLAGVRK
ncbi:MAG: hypothetical protein RL389_748 [Actinomycetota bacterium]